MSSIGERMRLVIEEQKFSIKQASEKTDIPYRSLQNYLNGQLPGPDALVKFRETFNVDLNWLLTGNGDVHKTLAKTASSIDPKLIKQIQRQLESSIPRYFKHKETSVVMNIFPLIYNNVCNIEDGDLRGQSIKQAVGLYLAGLQDDVTKMASDLAAQATTSEEKKSLEAFASSAQQGKEKILKRHDVELSPTIDMDTQVTQHISGSNHEVAGRDINKGK